MTHIWLDSLANILQPEYIIVIFIGTILGVVVGILPGIGPMSGLVIFMPIAVRLDPLGALIFSGGIYFGSVYGGSITAIVMNIPGDPTSTATTLDGYPLSQQGRAIEALSVSTISSAIGGVIGTLSLILFAPLFAQLIRYIGSPEYSLLGILGILMVCIVTPKHIIKCIALSVVGVIISMIGYSSVTGYTRMTMNITYLTDGIPIIVFVVGLMGISQAFIFLRYRGTISKTSHISGSVWQGIKLSLMYPLVTLQASIIGIILGIIPGIGGVSSNYLAYIGATRLSKDPHTFGTGRIEGVIAPETSNNATAAATLIPTLSFGIPGSSVAAVFLGIMMIHGLTPGIMLFREQAMLTYSFFWGLIICVLAIPIICLPILRYLTKLTIIPTVLLSPIIVMLCTFGIYMYRGSWLDVCVLYIIGVLGYLLKRKDYPIICIVMGFILGPIIEANWLRAVISYSGYSFLYSRPISLVLSGIIITIILTQLIRRPIHE